MHEEIDTLTVFVCREPIALLHKEVFPNGSAITNALGKVNAENKVVQKSRRKICKTDEVFVEIFSGMVELRSVVLFSEIIWKLVKK